jgi:hypothetical protein
MQLDKSELDALITRLTQTDVKGILKKILPREVKGMAEDARMVPPPLPKPDSGPWYERGFGTRYVSGGQVSGGVRTSEHLTDKWKVKVKPLEAELANLASYARYVVGKLQASVHQGRWPRVDKISKDRVKSMVRSILNETLKELRKALNG